MRTRPGTAWLGVIAWLAAAGALAAAPAGAETLHGVTFEKQVRAEDTSLALCSTGLLRRLLLKAYVAALYLDACAPATDPLTDVPKRLEIAYFWSIEGNRFGEAADVILQRSFEPAALAPLRDRIDALGRAYRDVQPGDRYALTYVPERGTTLSLNGQPLATVPGADFARAYFAIWLGSEPVDEALRDELLRSERL